MVKNPPARAGDVGLIPGSGKSSGGGNDNPLQILAWEIPWTGDLGGQQSMGSQKNRTPLSDQITTNWYKDQVVQKDQSDIEDTCWNLLDASL